MSVFGTEGSSSWTRYAVRRGDEWVLDTPYEVKSKGHLIGVVSPEGTKLTTNSYGAVRVDLPTTTTDGTDGFLYTVAGYAPDKASVSLLFKRMSVRISVSLDMSDYHGVGHLDRLTVRGVPRTAWIRPEDGLLTRNDLTDPCDLSVPTPDLKKMGMHFTFDTFPGENNYAPVLDMVIDGRSFTVALMSMSGRPWRAGEEWSHTVKVSDYGAKVVDESEVSAPADRLSDPITLMDDFDAPYFTATVTDQKWRLMYKDHPTLINVFVNNHSSSDFRGDVRWVLEGAYGSIVDQGLLFTDFHIEKGKYEGLPLPFRPTVGAGEYRLRLLLRNRGEEKWFRPFVADDSDREEDWMVRVLDTPQALLTQFRLGAPDEPGYGTVTLLKYDTPYLATFRYNSYFSMPIRATVRLYHERNMSAWGHSLWSDGLGEWRDLLAETEVTLHPEGGEVTLPYQVTSRRPMPKRYMGYCYLTIQYEGEEREYPMMAERGPLYQMALEIAPVTGSGLTLAKLLAGVSTVNSGSVSLE